MERRDKQEVKKGAKSCMFIKERWKSTWEKDFDLTA